MEDPVDLTADDAPGQGLLGADAQQSPEAELALWKVKLRHIRHQLAALRQEEAVAAAQVAELEAVIQLQAADEKRSQLSLMNWGHGFEWDDRVQRLLREKFGFASFRPMQREVINGVLSGKDVFVVMPTGSGKSLTFQLPALIMPGVCLVVSPLISLMHDQTQALQKLAISSALLTADTSKEERAAILAMVAKPLESGLKLLYVTPELLAKSKSTMGKLQAAYTKAALKLIVIDECHCCSHWGHEFRPDYLKLAVLKTNFSDVPLLALTATATQKVTEEVEKALAIPGCLQFRGQYNRPNLVYHVLPKAAAFADGVADIARFVHDHHPWQCGIVYCFSRKDSEMVAAGLSEHGIAAACYHANLELGRRHRIHAQWSAGGIQVMVATVAFGMGIDKHDVRFVIHHTLSKSIENYYQESGRAGRDGQPASCVTFYRAADVPRISSLVADSGNRDRALQLLYAMATFCDGPEAYTTCKRQPLAEYFGDVWQATDCGQRCDVCCGAYSGLHTRDVTSLARATLDVLADVERRSTPQKVERVTLLQLVKAMKATKQQAPLAGKDMSVADCERVVIHMLLQSLVAEEFVYTAYSVNSYLRLSPAAREILTGLRPMPQLTIHVGRCSATPRSPRIVPPPKRLRADPTPISDAEDS